MRNIVSCVIAAMLLFVFNVTVAAGPEPKTEEQKTLYAIGLALSQNLATFNLSGHREASRSEFMLS